MTSFLRNHHVRPLTRISSSFVSFSSNSSSQGSRLLTEEIFNKKGAKTAERIQSFSASELAKPESGGDGGFPKLNDLPEVIITGRANSGKSSLFNAVLGRKDLIKTSSKAGHTRKLDFFRIGSTPERQVILVDSPGYGGRGRPEWGKLFDTYIQKRKELRRIYITFNAKHGVNDHDEAMLRHLVNTLVDDFSSQYASSLMLSDVPSAPAQPPRMTQIQPIFTKIDLLPSKTIEARATISASRKKIHDAVKQTLEEVLKIDSSLITEESLERFTRMMCLEPILTTVMMSTPFGVEEVRKNIVDACNPT